MSTDASPGLETVPRPLEGSAPLAASGEPAAREIRPAFLPFVLRRSGSGVGGAAILALVVAWALGRMGAPAPWALPLVVFVIAAAAAAISSVIRVRRTRWQILPDRVTGTTGTAFSRRSTELELGRITQITLIRPFLEGSLFGTGYVTVKAAGSGARHLVMSSVPDPAATFEALQAAMRARGFSLKRSRLVSEARPAFVECFWAVGKVAFARSVIVLLVLGATLLVVGALAGLSLAVDSGGELLSIFRGDAPLPEAAPAWLTPGVAVGIGMGLAGVALLGFIWVVAPQVVRLLRLRRRHYRLFDDAVEMEARFLGHRHQVIPMENLSDVSLRQSFRQRLMGTSDVELSCQGRGRNIRFPWMARAEAFSESLRSILEAGGPERVRGVAVPAESESGSDPEADPAPAPANPSSTPSGEPPVELRIVASRVLAGYLFRALAGAVTTALVLAVVGVALFYLEPPLAAEARDTPFVLWGALGLVLLPLAVFVLRIPGRLIRLRASRFRIDAREVEAEYALVSRERHRFALDRVTAVASRQGLLDRLFGTWTLTFHSIGSRRPIRFPHVRARMLQMESLIRRVGLTPGPARETVEAQVTPLLWFRGNPGTVIWTGIWVLATTPFALLHPLVLVLPVLAILGLVQRFGADLWDAGSGRMELGADYVLVRRGRIRRTVLLSGYRQLREVNSRFYPFSRAGGVAVRAAGGATGRLEYVADPESLHTRLDSVLLRYGQKGRRGREELDSRERLTTRPQARNDVMALTGICVVLFPLLLAYPFMAAALVLYHRRIRYVLEGDRVVESRGILVRRVRSILYDRIDSVSTSKGFLNGILQNGQVEISTATGAGAQMVMRNVPQEEDVAQALHRAMEAA